MMEKLLKAAAWVSMLGLVVLTVIPADDRPVTGVQHGWEHFIAFGPAGLLLGLAYVGRLGWLYPGAIAFALALELSQIPLVTRHARVDDFVVNAFSLCLGLAVAQTARTKARKDMPPAKLPPARIDQRPM